MTPVTRSQTRGSGDLSMANVNTEPVTETPDPSSDEDDSESTASRYGDPEDTTYVEGEEEEQDASELGHQTEGDEKETTIGHSKVGNQEVEDSETLTDIYEFDDALFHSESERLLDDWDLENAREAESGEPGEYHDEDGDGADWGANLESPQLFNISKVLAKMSQMELDDI
ncbi:hypothetical protein FBEOM_8897 [Fusarium beomiforme]|uniref:Uncharacterized protein n=1 Tax=Fusarium beomiforme TaxID=44412 RepID=A0A9P5DWD9_9HYPO|nr:hypothetical protein FBEOM_8897 [Fusarium beomiforme]